MSQMVNVGTGSGGQGAATLTCQLTGSGNNVQSLNIILPIVTNGNSPLSCRVFNLNSGDNTINVPGANTGVGYVAILMPNAPSAVVVTLKGSSGDTGIVVGPSGPSVAQGNGAPIMFPLGTSPISTFIINVSAPVNGVYIWFI